MRIISWNVNGLRSVISKNVLPDLFKNYDPDIICLQETRCPCNTEIPNISHNYPFSYICESDKKGYAGVGIFSKVMPIKTIENDLIKGRCICLEFKMFYLVNLYVPNSKNDLSALPMRTSEWEPKVLSFIQDLQIMKPVIVTGDLNVAPTSIDTYNKTTSTTNGTTSTERDDYIKLLKNGDLIDVWRELNPGKKNWTWYSNFNNARSLGKGWRIDMILISKCLFESFSVNADILSDTYGSDHVPITLDIDFNCSS